MTRLAVVLLALILMVMVTDIVTRAEEWRPYSPPTTNFSYTPVDR